MKRKPKVNIFSKVVVTFYNFGSGRRFHRRTFFRCSRDAAYDVALAYCSLYDWLILDVDCYE